MPAMTLAQAAQTFQRLFLHPIPIRAEQKKLAL